jgi:formylglycine-generating enzyme required for sulfatase activity
MASPRVFVSYSHHDDAFTVRLVGDLTTAGAIVRLDVGDVGADDFKERINRALASCEWFLLVLTPSALKSSWVMLEMDMALRLWVYGRVRDVIQLLAEPVDHADIPATWGNFTHIDATRDYASARGRVLDALGLPPFPDSPNPSNTPRHAPALQPAQGTAPLRVPPAARRPPMPSPPQVPQHLRGLGFAMRGGRGTEVILPPLCAVPAGEFLMGSDVRRDKQAYDSELPRHRVAVPAFQIARFPVTVAEYACFVRAGHREPRDWRPQLRSPDHPVVSVSWRDATAYATWLAAETGQPWRLPSEAEWEKAARWDPDTRTARIYPWGDTFDQLRCHTRETGTAGATMVRAYLAGASPCGAQGLAGNVWEWTSSLFMRYPYVGSDGREAPNSQGNRVRRGGSWSSSARSARAAFRYYSRPDDVGPALGFRLALASGGS